MIKKLLSKFKKLLLAIGIYCLMAVNRLIIVFVPFNKIAPIMGQLMVEADYGNDRQKRYKVIVIGRMIDRLSHYTPWKSKCYVMALTAKELFYIFKIPSTVYLGLAKNEESLELSAHAWVKYDNIIVTGGKEMMDFTPVAYYGS